MRVLVCGGRKYDDYREVYAQLNALAAAHGKLTIIEGGATGADRLARQWAQNNGRVVMTFEADWKAHGTAAGPIRNARMLREDGRPDLVLAFPGGRGTADMVRQARAAGVEVREIK